MDTLTSLRARWADARVAKDEAESFGGGDHERADAALDALIAECMAYLNVQDELLAIDTLDGVTK